MASLTEKADPTISDHADARARFGPRYQVMLLALIMLVTAFSYVDRTVVQILAQPIKDDLALSDLQLGLIGGLSFAIFYSCMGLPIARLAERKSRIVIIAISVGIFSIMSALCAVATNFTELFLFRIGVGIGEAGVMAPATALLGDHFAPHRRGFALSVMRLGFPLGAAFGAFLGAWIGATYGWRPAMLAVSLPGIVTAVLLPLLLREPPRGMCDPPEQQKAAAIVPPMREAFGALLGRAEFRHMLFGLGIATMGLYSAGAFSVPYFMRVHGLSLAEAGSYLGIISSLSSLVGMSIGGLGIDFIARRSIRWYALVPAIGVLLTAPIYFYAYMAAPPLVAMMCMLVGGIFLFFHSVPTLVAMQNLVASNVRATAAFLYFFVQTLVGVGFGPPVTGYLSDLYASHHLGAPFSQMCHGAALSAACESASAFGIRMALGTSCGFFAWGALHYFIAARLLGRRERMA